MMQTFLKTQKHFQAKLEQISALWSSATKRPHTQKRYDMITFIVQCLLYTYIFYTPNLHEHK